MLRSTCSSSPRFPFGLRFFSKALPRLRAGACRRCRPSCRPSVQLCSPRCPRPAPARRPCPCPASASPSEPQMGGQAASLLGSSWQGPEPKWLRDVCIKHAMLVKLHGGLTQQTVPGGLTRQTVPGGLTRQTVPGGLTRQTVTGGLTMTRQTVLSKRLPQGV
jgi:hypothetical protein